MNRPRDRASAAGLLPRMEARPWRDGKTLTYRYHVAGGKPVNLGTDRAEAIRKVLDMLGTSSDSISSLWDTYCASKAWRDLAESTRHNYTQASTHLLRVFGDVSVARIRPSDINRYLRTERADAPARANQEFALLSNLCTLAVSRGDVDANPCHEVQRNKRNPRTESPSPDDLMGFLKWANERGGRSALVLAGMAEFAALAGSRRIEFRTLHWPQVSETEVRLTRAKQRGREVAERVEISPALSSLLDRMRAIAADSRIGAVFPASGGDCYGEEAFRSAWSRLQNAALKDGVLKRRIRFHDLRAFYVTQHKLLRDALPDLHGNPAITARVYERSKQARRKAL